VSATSEGRHLVIGVGNPDRGDDAIGLVVARLVRQTRPSGVTVIEESGDGITLMELWRNAGIVIVIDAAQCDTEPGTIYRFDARLTPLPAQSFHCSTHAFDLAQAVELSRTLNQLPNRLIVYGIVGKQFELGTALDPSVDAAARQVARRVLQDLRDAWGIQVIGEIPK